MLAYPPVPVHVHFDAISFLRQCVLRWLDQREPQQVRSALQHSRIDDYHAKLCLLREQLRAA
eukprot:2782293-Heterocapsa_arctica.AAC.1